MQCVQLQCEITIQTDQNKEEYMEDSKLPIKVKKLSELEYLNIFNIPENKHGVTVKRTMLVDPYLGRSTLNRISLDFSTGVIESNLLDSPLNKGFLNVDEYGCSVRDMAHPRLKHHKIYSIDDCEIGRAHV